jgi:hypothetical protein
MHNSINVCSTGTSLCTCFNFMINVEKYYSYRNGLSTSSVCIAWGAPSCTYNVEKKLFLSELWVFLFVFGGDRNGAHQDRYQEDWELVEPAVTFAQCQAGFPKRHARSACDVTVWSASSSSPLPTSSMISRLPRPRKFSTLSFISRTQFSLELIAKMQNVVRF